MIVDACCGVFNTLGRGMRIYRSSLKSIGPRIGRDDIAKEYPCDMVGDLRGMVVYLIYNHCTWLPSPNDVPQPYTLSLVAEYFHKHKAWAERANKRATALLLTDANFQTLAGEVVDVLSDEGFKVRLNAPKV